MRGLIITSVVIAAALGTACESKSAEDKRSHKTSKRDLTGPAKPTANDGGHDSNKPPAPSSSGPYLVLIKGGGQLVAVNANGPGVQRELVTGVKGRVNSAITVNRGTSLLFVTAANELWRLTPGSPAQKLWSGKGPVSLYQASADGKTIIARGGRLFTIKGNTATVLDTGLPAAVHERLGAISADGQRVLASFVPKATCNETPPKTQATTTCAFEVWGLDRRVGRWQRIAATKLHNYNGRFVPGTKGKRIVFEVPQPDPKCRTRPLWGCGVEDLYAINFDGSDRKLVRHSAWVPRFSPDGKWMSVCSPWPGRPRQQLLVGAPLGQLKTIANDCHYATQWGPASQWIAYEPPRPGVQVIKRDGTGKLDVGTGRPLGFLRNAPTLGKVVPRPLTRVDHLEQAVKAAAKHKRGAEPLALFGVYQSLATKAKVPAAAKLMKRRRAPEYFGQKARSLAVVSDTALCHLHRLLGRRKTPYAVLSDPDKPFVLLTNKLAPGEKDRGTLKRVIRRSRPTSVGRPINIEFNGAIELMGVDMPRRVQGSQKFKVTLYFRVLRRVMGSWKTFVHFDRPGLRFQADHSIPCGTYTLEPGEWITDTFDAVAIANEPGRYRMYMGFYRGSAGSWHNMKVSRGKHDGHQRVEIGTIEVY